MDIEEKKAALDTDLKRELDPATQSLQQEEGQMTRHAGETAAKAARAGGSFDPAHPTEEGILGEPAWSLPIAGLSSAQSLLVFTYLVDPEPGPPEPCSVWRRLWFSDS